MEKCIGAVFILAVLFIVSDPANAQVLDKAKFEKSENEFYDQIKEEIKEFNKKGEVEKLDFKLDFSGKDLPKSISEFKYYWHTPPLSQGKTGSCWCFSTTSFFESEIKRIHNKEIKLSEMYTVYWEFVEKARRFVRKRGDSMFEEGSEANAVPRIWKKYGVVPAAEYSGMLPDQKYHDHKLMHTEMQSYLLNCVKTNYWDEDAILANIKSILNYYMGEPPLRIEYEEVERTPLEFLHDVTKLELDDYVDILSLKQKPILSLLPSQTIPRRSTG